MAVFENICKELACLDNWIHPKPKENFILTLYPISSHWVQTKLLGTSPNMNLFE